MFLIGRLNFVASMLDAHCEILAKQIRAQEDHMTSELDTLRTRCERTSTDLLHAINQFEHAIADCSTAESARFVASVIGTCYAAFDRVNAQAISRLAQFDVEKMLSVNRE